MGLLASSRSERKNVARDTSVGQKQKSKWISVTKKIFMWNISTSRFVFFCLVLPFLLVRDESVILTIGINGF